MKAWKKAIGIGIAVAAVGFVIPTATAVLIVAQPWVSANSGSEQPPPVDSQRLETDTRKLAEDFVPRDGFTQKTWIVLRRTFERSSRKLALQCRIRCMTWKDERTEMSSPDLVPIQKIPRLWAHIMTRSVNFLGRTTMRAACRAASS